MPTLDLRIRQARRRLQLSQRALANKLGVTRTAVSQWEAPSGSKPRQEHLRQLSLLSGVNFEWLATGRGAIAHDENAAACLALEGWEQRVLAALRRMPQRNRLMTVEWLELQALPRHQQGGVEPAGLRSVAMM